MKYNYKYILHGASYSLSITLIRQLHNPKGFPDSSVGKESACNVGYLCSIAGLGRSPGEGKGYPLQHSVLENSMDCIVPGVTKRRTQRSDFHHTITSWFPVQVILSQEEF